MNNYVCPETGHSSLPVNSFPRTKATPLIELCANKPYQSSSNETDPVKSKATVPTTPKLFPSFSKDIR